METIDKGMIAAIQEAAGRLGSQNELSRKSGVPQQQISSYLSGKTKGISLENWLKLLPHIKAYLPADHPSLRSSQAAGPRLAMFADGAGGGPTCPLTDCPAQGIPHEPATEMLLDAWGRLGLDHRLDLIKEANRLAALEPRKAGESSGRKSPDK